MGELDAKARGLEMLAEMIGERGDLGRLDDALPALTAYLKEFASPDFVCKLIGPPGSGADMSFPGVDGLAAALREWGQAFEEIRAVLEEVLESKGHIVLLVNQVATTRHDGVEVTQPSAMVWAYEGGRLARLEFHLDRDVARRTAGIEA